MIGMYMNQTATLKAKGAVNDANEATYAPDVSIKCRIENKRRMVRNRAGQEVLSTARIFTLTPVKPDDIVYFGGIDWIVISVAEEAGLSGNVEFYEVSL